MSASHYIKEIRSLIGNKPLLIPSVAAVILDEHKRLLLQQKQDGSWSLPAGMIELGESPSAAIKREVLEETGYTVSAMKILGAFGGEGFSFTYPNGDRVDYTVILFRCHVTGLPSKELDEETKALQYFSKDKMPDLALPYPKDCLFDELDEPYIESASECWL
ncbi:NUDIX domain-containing protein [Vibrio penaeicida]|uniref:NUDIX domain-containing protein n=1 Tax=Vibrio penaeicida TaxID=104609 RepID=UPI002733AAAF|nr:NUDIX domain-containing protein [Vibrio penaeicida]MDP2575080.1 NUDIX domain-containing protein [Vibrio penaeicida]